MSEEEEAVNEKLTLQRRGVAGGGSTVTQGTLVEESGLQGRDEDTWGGRSPEDGAVREDRDTRGTGYDNFVSLEWKES